LSQARLAYLDGFKLNGARDALAFVWTATMMAAVRKLLVELDHFGSGNA
jgi:hypothetical protein